MRINPGEESFLSQTKRHAIEIWTRWGARNDGKICAMEGDVWGDKGPYAGLGAFVVKKCGLHLSGPYYIPNIRVDSYSVYTNNIFASAMRGFGVSQAAIAHEAQMDELAKKTKRAPPKQVDFIDGLRDVDPSASGTHFDPKGVKTTLTADNLLKMYSELTSG